MRDIKLKSKVRGLKIQSGDVVEYNPQNGLYSYLSETADEGDGYRKWNAVAYDFSPEYVESLVEKGVAEYVGPEKLAKAEAGKALSEVTEEPVESEVLETPATTGELPKVEQEQEEVKESEENFVADEDIAEKDEKLPSEKEDLEFPYNPIYEHLETIFKFQKEHEQYMEKYFNRLRERMFNIWI